MMYKATLVLVLVGLTIADPGHLYGSSYAHRRPYGSSGIGRRPIIRNSGIHRVPGHSSSIGIGHVGRGASGFAPGHGIHQGGVSGISSQGSRLGAHLPGCGHPYDLSYFPGLLNDLVSPTRLPVTYSSECQKWTYSQYCGIWYCTKVYRY